MLSPWLSETESLLPRFGDAEVGGSGGHGLGVARGVGGVLTAAPLHAVVSVHGGPVCPGSPQHAGDGESEVKSDKKSRDNQVNWTLETLHTPSSRRQNFTLQGNCLSGSV